MGFWTGLFGTAKAAIWAMVVMLAIVMLGIMGCYLMGCQQATVTEKYASHDPAQWNTRIGEAVPGATKEVERTTRHTRVATWAGPAPGETISHMQPLEVTDTGAKFSGMKPFDLARAGPTILIWAGIAVAAIGLGLVIFLPGARTAGLYAAGGGGALIVAGIAFEAYPWIALVMVGIVVVGGLAWFIFGTAAGARLKESFRVVVAGVEATKQTAPAAAEAVTANIAVAASGAGKAAAIKETVNKAKKA